jgi:galactonate dehydratase
MDTPPRVGGSSESDRFLLQVMIAEVKSFPVRQGLFLVKIESDEGYYGWGEAGPSAWGRELAAQGLVTHFAELLKGRDPGEIGALWQEMYRGRGSGFDGGRLESAVISAIDVALHDLVARSLGIPVYQLLGGAHRAFVPCFTPVSGPDQPDGIEDVRAMLAEGWEVLRLSMGGFREKGIFEPRESLSVTAKWLAELREAVGPDPVLGIDYHAMLNVAQAASFCHRLPPGTLDFIEDPLHEETPSAYKALRRMTEIPFAVGEVFTSKWDWLPYIEKDLINLARIDIANVGGFTEAMKVAAWCEAHYIDMMPHLAISPIMTATILHFAAAVPNFAWMEDRNRDFRALRAGAETSFRHHDYEMYPVQPTPDGVRYPVPTTPGLGVEINEGALHGEYEMRKPKYPRRRDGSLAT